MKRLLYVIGSGQIGGMELHTLELVKGLLPRGFAVWVVCPDGPIIALFKAAGAQVVVDQPTFDLDPFYISRLVRLLQSNKIDIVHGHELKAGVAAILAGKLAKTPLKVIHVHTPISQWPIPVIKKKLEIWLYQFVANHLADKVVALNNAVKEIRIRDERILPDKIVVIPNGINNSLFSGGHKLPKDKTRIFTVGALGRLTEEKGFPVLLNGFSLFLKRFCGDPEESWPRLIIGGSGRLEDTLKLKAQELGVYRYVTFAGLISEEQKPPFFHSLDIFVFPSLAEGFGLVLVEAMAASLPCLASDLPVLREVGGEAVEFFRTGDPVDLSEKLYGLYKDYSRREALGEAGRKRVNRNYTQEKFWQSYKGLYEGSL